MCSRLFQQHFAADRHHAGHLRQEGQGQEGQSQEGQNQEGQTDERDEKAAASRFSSTFSCLKSWPRKRIYFILFDSRKHWQTQYCTLADCLHDTFQTKYTLPYFVHYLPSILYPLSSTLEGAARYAGLLLAPVEGFGRGRFFCPSGKQKRAFYTILLIFGDQ